MNAQTPGPGGPPGSGGKSVDDLIDSVNESAQHIGSLAVTFLATAVYIGIAVASTTHQILLLGSSIPLPLINASIPIEKFYFLAPALLLLLHMNLLVQRSVLVFKLSKLDQALFRDDPRLLYPSLVANLPVLHDVPVRIPMQVLFFAVYIAAPVGLLLWTQSSFLPYHSAWLTTWHEVLVLIDLGLLWHFLGRKLWERPSRLLTIVSLAASLAVCYAAVFLLVGSGNGMEVRLGRHPPLAERIQRDLQLSGQILVRQEPGQDVLSRYPSLGDALRQNAKGVQLSRRDLRGANLAGVTLVNADLREADLTGANLSGADLRGADLGPLNPSTRGDRRHATRLKHANLAGARLDGTDLSYADLRFANLDGATFAASSLLKADLRRVRGDRADFRGALLNGAWLSLSSLRDTDFTGASLSSANLTGADLLNARLKVANLQGALLAGAHLVEAKLQGADLRRAESVGTDFRNAELQRVLGLNLSDLVLRGARLAGLRSCEPEQQVANPAVADLRDVDFEEPFVPVTDCVEKRPLLDHLKEAVQRAGLPPEALEKNPVLQQAVQRIARAAPHGVCPGDRSKTSPEQALQAASALAQQTCLGTQLLPSTPPEELRAAVHTFFLLYDGDRLRGPMAQWPAPRLKDDDFRKKLARRLVVKACTDFEFALSLARRIASCHTPPNAKLGLALARRLSSFLPHSEEAEEKNGCPALSTLPQAELQVIVDVANGVPPAQELLEEVCQ